jgi:DNA-directed RNA polymerase sigma subunit (sigma70/sigma32)
MLKRISEALKADASLDALFDAAGPDQPYPDGTTGATPTLGGALEDRETPRPDVAYGWTVDTDRTAEIDELIENEAGLTREEKKIIRQFYGLNLTGKTTPLKEIASRRRISSARASQIKEQALVKITAAIRRRRDLGVALHAKFLMEGC